MSSSKYEDLDALEAQMKSVDPDDFIGDGEPLHASSEHGIIVSIRFDRETLRKIRSAARQQGIRDADFIRKVTIAATDHLE